MIEQARKAQVIVKSLDEAAASVDRAVAHPVDDMRPVFVRSALFHWFSIMYDEGKAHRFDLLSSVDALKEQVRLLKERNEELQRRLPTD